MRRTSAIAASYALTILAGTLAVSPHAGAAEPKRIDRTGVLAGLPSEAGPHIARIQALGDNEWLNLGSPAPDPRWGKGRGRSWSSKMPYAPELGGAFLNGQGVHGYIKPDGYFMDDIWFYDLLAHRWICIYPGTDTRNFVSNIERGDLKVNDDGQLVDRDGRPVPFSAIPGHSYQDHAYDLDHGRYVFGGGAGIGSEQHVRDQEWLKKGGELLRSQGKTDRVAGSSYFFNTVTGQFERPPASGENLSGGGTSTVLFHLPTKKSLWRYSRGQTLFGDAATNRWTDAKAAGPTPTGIDFGACYDSKRERVYVLGGGYRGPYAPGEGKIYVYDVKANTWSNLPDKGTVPDNFASNYACVHYDAAGDRVVNVVFSARRTGVSAFDPETGAWGDAPAPLPANISQGCWSGFYFPELNAHFFHIAGDSRDDGTMWVYRYQKAAP
ncbi:MAG: hypothetical protein WD069_09155 [Planctomycetales bacterium]